MKISIIVSGSIGRTSTDRKFEMKGCKLAAYKTNASGGEIGLNFEEIMPVSLSQGLIVGFEVENPDTLD